MPNTNESNQNQLIWIMCILMIIVIVVAAVVFHDNRAEETKKKLRMLAIIPHDDLAEDTTMPDTDAWGTPIHFKRKSSEDAIAQTLTSAGADRTMGTDDDLFYTDVDRNNSKLLGKWVGSRTKEFVKGVFSGEAEKSRFDKMK